MVLRHRRRDNHRARTRHMTGIVTLVDRGSERGDILRPGRIAITSADGNPPATSDEGQGAHPCATDSHEVDRSGIRGVEEIHL
jgi:hypothetical protein